MNMSLRGLSLVVLVLGFQLLPSMVGVADAKILLVSKVGANNPDCSATACLTIQFALDQAAAGDSVLVGAGDYRELVSLKTGVYLLSDQGAVIRGGGLGPTVTANNVGPDTVLEGFVVMEGRGGIAILNSSVVVRRNTIFGNSGVADGGGILVQNSFATIVNNLIAFNAVDHFLRTRGGGIAVIDSPSVSIVNNTITANRLLPTSSLVQGLAVYIGGSTVSIQNNIVSNHANRRDIYIEGSSVQMLNNLFFNNPAGACEVDSVGLPTVADLNSSSLLTSTRGNV